MMKRKQRRSKKKNKGTTIRFELINAFDEDGNPAQYWNPVKMHLKKNDPLAEKKAERILKQLCDHVKNEEFQNDTPSKTEEFNVMTDYKSIRDNLTEEERKKFTQDGMFPNDGFDYSQYVAKPVKKRGDGEKEVLSEEEIDEYDMNEEKMSEMRPEERKLLERIIKIEKKENGETIDTEVERVEIIDYGDEFEEETVGEKELFDDVDEEVFEGEIEKEIDDDDYDYDYDENDGNIKDFFGLNAGPVDDYERKGKGKKKKKVRFLDEVEKKKTEEVIEIKEKDDNNDAEEEVDINNAKSKVTEDKKKMNEMFQLMLDKMDEELFGEFDEPDSEEEKGGVGYADIEPTLDEFIQESKTVDTGDINHEDDGKISKEEMERLERYAPHGMILLSSALRKRLRQGEVDRKEIVEIMIKRLKVEREMKERGEIVSDEEEERTYGLKPPRKKLEFDAESILTTYSNTENIPNVLAPIHQKKKKKKKIDKGPSIESQIQDLKENEIQFSKRGKKSEKDKEEKKKMKKLLKEQRKEKRILKKKLKGKYGKELQRRRKIESKNPSKGSHLS